MRHNKSEVVWNRFRSAADKFFERYHNRHQIAAAEKIAEHTALVVALEEPRHARRGARRSRRSGADAAHDDLERAARRRR